MLLEKLRLSKPKSYFSIGVVADFQAYSRVFRRHERIRTVTVRMRCVSRLPSTLFFFAPHGDDNGHKPLFFDL